MLKGFNFLRSRNIVPNVDITEMDLAKVMILLPKELQLVILSFLPPRDLCNLAAVCKEWQNMCGAQLVWKKKCEDYGIQQTLSKQKSTINELCHSNYREIFKLQCCPVWDPETKHPSIVLSNNNKSAYHADNGWYVVVSKYGNEDSFGNVLPSRTWHIRMDKAHYILGVGIVVKPCYLDRDLSGSNPAISFFSPGDFYYYPFERVTREYKRTSDRNAFGSGDVISVMVKITENSGEVLFFLNGASTAKFGIEKGLEKSTWYLGVNLCNGSQVTLLPQYDLQKTE